MKIFYLIFCFFTCNQILAAQVFIDTLTVNSLTNMALLPSKLVGSGSSTNLISISVGSGLSLDGDTLTASGGAGSQTPLTTNVNGAGFGITNTGIIIVTNAVITSLTPSEFLVSNATNGLASFTGGSFDKVISKILATNNTFTYGWRTRPHVDECTVATGELLGANGQANSGSSSQGATGLGSHFGLFTDSTVTTANAAAGHRTAACAACFLFSSVRCGLLSVVKTPTAIPDGTETYEWFIGFGDTTTTEAVDGAYFYVSTNSANWSAKTSSNSARTTITTTGNVALAASTWYWLYQEVDTTTADFWVSTDGISFTHIGYCTANIPSAVGRETATYHVIVKSAGTTARIGTIDKMALWPLF